MNRIDVEKFLAVGSTGDEAKDQVLTLRRRLFGGENEYGLQQQKITETVTIEEISKQIDNIRAEKQAKEAELDLSERLIGKRDKGDPGPSGIYSEILKDEHETFYTGNRVGGLSHGKPRKPHTKDSLAKERYGSKYDELTDAEKKDIDNTLYPYGDSTAAQQNYWAREEFNVDYEHLAPSSKRR